MTSPDVPFRSFPTTIWSDILAAGNPASPQCRNKLELLVHSYWTPVYAYVRVAWHKSDDDAKDLTQAFFAHVLEKNYLSNVRPERGSFRGYLKQALKHFLIDADRASRSRRPERALFSLEAVPGELERISPPSPGDTPERAFDREWFRVLFEQAIGALRERLQREGKTVYFDAFRLYCLEPASIATGQRPSTILTADDPGGPTYHQVGQRLGIKDSDVRNYLAYCRTVLKALLRERFRDYVETDDRVDEELEEALGG